MNKNEFRQPMQPWPGLEKYLQTSELPKSGLRLSYYDTGKKDALTIFLVHGLGDESDTWRHIIEPLSPYARVIVPDLPGFGRSEKPHIKYTLPFLTQTLLEFIDQMQVDRSLWIGNSLGAILSQSMALEHPERVLGLVLIDGSMVQSSAQKVSLTNILFLLPGIGKWMYNRLRSDPQSAYESLRPYYYDLDQMPEADRNFLFQRVNQRVWDDNQRDAYLSTLRNMVTHLMSRQSQLKETIPQLEAPALIVWGESDQVSSVENGHLLQSILPNARLITLPKTGHVVQQERPQDLLDAILGDEGLKIRG
jgi:pimeloyl-ACP methyl ester carboxylesterase